MATDRLFSGLLLSGLCVALLALVGCDGAEDLTQRSDPCPAGTQGCPCAAAPPCGAGLICDGATRVCRAPTGCDALTCAEHQRCAADDGADARCAAECDPGYQWDPAAGVCVAEPPSCEADSPHSILAACTALNRGCLPLAQRGAQCGACQPGFVGSADVGTACTPEPACSADQTAACASQNRGCEAGACGACAMGFIEADGACVQTTCGPFEEPGALGTVCADLRRACTVGPDGAGCGGCLPDHLPTEAEGELDPSVPCRPRATCAALNCVGSGRLCLQGEGDDECGACLAGFESVGGNCVPERGRRCDGGGGLADGCAEEHRGCEETADGARCGGCVDGRVEHPETGACVAPQTCEALDCAASGRRCDPVPTAVCTGCAEGFVQDRAGYCRRPLTCEDLGCADPGGRRRCERAAIGETADDQCVGQCSDDELWNGRDCAPCPETCVGVGLTGSRHPEPTTAGWCVCDTEPGYFYSVANDVGAAPCDADGDGWVRETARRYIQGDDPVLNELARCTVRTVSQISLVGEPRADGERPAETIAFRDPLPLYESARNDDDEALVAAFQRAELPVAWQDGVGADGMPVMRPLVGAGAFVNAARLNGFTKLCTQPNADHNDNGLADAYEHQRSLPGPGRRPDQAPFTEYGYFLELHHGEFQQIGEDRQSRRAFGTWRIQERPRASGGDAAPARVPLRYRDQASGWETCDRLPDPQVGLQDPPVGLDFARPAPEDDSPWPVMTHHSQFKCVVLSETPDATRPPELTPDQAMADFELNRCTPAGAGADGAPWLQCAALARAERPQAGQAVWGAVPYRPYGNTLNHVGYRGGCINACAEALTLHDRGERDERRTCPGPNRPLCEAQGANFGHLTCLEDPCDGVDNDVATDMDDVIDEGLPGPGDPPLECQTGLRGRCGTGTATCNKADRVLECTARSPIDEQCNNQDDDCDGRVDEDTLGVVCAGESASLGLPAGNLLGVCRLRRLVCQDGVGDCTPENIEAFEPDGETLCDGLDNDCDGQIDEATHMRGQPIPEGVGQVGSFGDDCIVEPAPSGVCRASTWQCVDHRVQCAPLIKPGTFRDGCPAGIPGPCTPACDGLDNDCDGATDEDGACERVWTTPLNAPLWVNPIHDTGDREMGGSSVRQEVTVRFGGVGTDEVEATISLTTTEIGHDRTAGRASRTFTQSLEPGTTVTRILGSGSFEAVYIDDDDEHDVVRNTTNGLALTEAGKIREISAEPAVTDLVCNGRTRYKYDLMAGNAVSNSLLLGVAYCTAYASVRYEVAPQRPQCLDDDELGPDVCDGLDNDCDGVTDEGDAPQLLTIHFGPGTRYGEDSSLFVREDGVERAITGVAGNPGNRLTALEFVQYGAAGRYWPIGQAPSRAQRTVRGTQLELWVEGDGVFEIDRITDQVGEVVVEGDTVPAALRRITRDAPVSASFGGRDQLLGQACGTNEGQCTVGVTECSLGGAITCSGQQPEVELCNAEDDDCDGTTDEGTRVECLSPTCGPGTRPCANRPDGDDAMCLSPCGRFCGIPGFSECRPGADAFSNECRYELPDDFCPAGDAGARCREPELQCPLGDAGRDCRRLATFDPTQPCIAGVGACRAQGAWVCDAETGLKCTAQPGEPRPGGEICNGEDDDCDGETDEDVAPVPVEGLEGCADAARSCVNGALAPIDYGVDYEGANEETCDDQQDNDCDGLTDADDVDDCPAPAPPP